MKDKLIFLAQRLRRTHITEPVEALLRDEAFSGKIILVAVALALIAANSPLMPWYDGLLHSELSLGFSDWNISLDIKHWISEGLMVFFFLVVGLELKRELLRGKLRRKETAILPLAAAIGGMIVPALIFVSFNLNRETISGWAIPTATDIALAVGILALLGDRIPASVRIFLLALAIVDDILAVIVIAIFYNTGLDVALLLAMLALAASVYLLGRFRLLPMWGFVIAGIVMWILSLDSGIHPSIIGALLGFIAPMISKTDIEEQLGEKVERAIIPLSTLVVVPLFAFANTGVNFKLNDINMDDAIPLGGGIIAGLVIGKIAGILGASWIMVKIGLAKLPENARWSHIVGIGSLSGIGFTVAIFVTDLSFTNPEYVTLAKLSIFAASAIAAVIGLLILRFCKTNELR